MKRWMPDYANATGTNVLTGSVLSITAGEDGFVYIFWEGYSDSGNAATSITVNDTRCARIVSENTSAAGARTGSLSVLLPVASGDIVRIVVSGGTNTNIKEGYFIPGKWV